MRDVIAPASLRACASVKFRVLPGSAPLRRALVTRSSRAARARAATASRLIFGVFQSQTNTRIVHTRDFKRFRTEPGPTLELSRPQAREKPVMVLLSMPMLLMTARRAQMRA